MKPATPSAMPTIVRIVRGQCSVIRRRDTVRSRNQSEAASRLISGHPHAKLAAARGKRTGGMALNEFWLS
jgi:hypothetical protein